MTVVSPLPFLSLRGIHKRFGPTHALKGVDLDLVPGEALALLGENGAGKSTLVKTLTGVHAADEGQILVEGRVCSFLRARDAQAAGIAAVHQETVMFDELSAAENIFIGRQPMRRMGPFEVIDWARMNREAQAVLDRVGAGFAATTLVRHLSLGQRHLIEIARVENDGAIGHAEVRIGDSVVMMFDVPGDWPETPAFLRLYVADGDAWFSKALDAGASVVTEMTEMFWGDRVGRVRDPLGNIWWIQQRVDDLDPQEMERRARQPEFTAAMEYVQRSLRLH